MRAAVLVAGMNCPYHAGAARACLALGGLAQGGAQTAPQRGRMDGHHEVRSHRVRVPVEPLLALRHPRVEPGLLAQRRPLLADVGRRGLLGARGPPAHARAAARRRLSRRPRRERGAQGRGASRATVLVTTARGGRARTVGRGAGPMYQSAPGCGNCWRRNPSQSRSGKSARWASSTLADAVTV